MQVLNRHSTRDKRKNLRKNQTEAEGALWERLRGRRFMGCKFFRQYGIGEYIADFYCPQHKLGIEVDGSQHHSNDSAEYDRVRADFMCSLDIRTIRFSNLDVLQNMDGVLLQIGEKIGTASDPLFGKEGATTQPQGELRGLL
jgi:very-short-patch-repair endonuclease